MAMDDDMLKDWLSGNAGVPCLDAAREIAALRAELDAHRARDQARFAELEQHVAKIEQMGQEHEVLKGRHNALLEALAQTVAQHRDGGAAA